MTEQEILDYIESRQEDLLRAFRHKFDDGRAYTANQLALATSYELGRLKRRILDGRITAKDLQGWILIYAKPFEVPVAELIAQVRKQTGADKELVVEQIWNLVDKDKLDYTTSAMVSLKQ